MSSPTARPTRCCNRSRILTTAPCRANDCFRPVARYFDRISRPEHILTALPRAMRVMTDPANCGPVRLAFCQDTQAEAYDYPVEFFTPQVWHIRRPEPDQRELAEPPSPRSKPPRNPLIVAGGGVIYSGAEATLRDFATATTSRWWKPRPARARWIGKKSCTSARPASPAPAAATQLAAEADLVIGVGTRFQDFTTGQLDGLFRPGPQAAVDQHPRL